ncbi:MAG: Arm DNA-binding domain-containing protein [Clostridia bacterium]|nr:Arm DNA-binding domain-containing protein [Clostridia bacterium]
MSIYKDVSKRKVVTWKVKFNYQDPVTKLNKQSMKRGFKTLKEAKLYEASLYEQHKQEIVRMTLGAGSPFHDVYEAYWRHVQNQKNKLANTDINNTEMINTHSFPIRRGHFSNDRHRYIQRKLYKSQTVI